MDEIIYGIHAIRAMLKHSSGYLKNIFLLRERNGRCFQSLIKELKNAGITIHIVNRHWFDHNAKGVVHQGIAARIKIKKQYQENDIPKLLKQQTMPLLLVLDCITDPRNFGACLRCAEAAGVDAVIIPRNRAAPLNGIAAKVASGAAETIPIVCVTNLARTLILLRELNIWIFGTAIESKNSLYQSKLTIPLAFVMGSEGTGIRYLIRKYCDEIISIPMLGMVSSLNISVATGVCLFEAVRQRIRNHSIK